MSELLKTLEDRADVIVLDSPPLLPVTDAAVLAPACRWCGPRRAPRQDAAGAGHQSARGPQGRGCEGAAAPCSTGRPSRVRTPTTTATDPAITPRDRVVARSSGAGTAVASRGTSTTTVVPREASRRREPLSRSWRSATAEREGEDDEHGHTCAQQSKSDDLDPAPDVPGGRRAGRRTHNDVQPPRARGSEMADLVRWSRSDRR